MRLVSFPTCPYVQRSVITLREKGAAFELVNIDLDEPPEWFQQESPLGKVPILITAKGVLFESAAINEYVDRTTDGDLMPQDAWLQAQTRAWVEFGGECLLDYYHALMAQDRATCQAHVAALRQKMPRLDDRIEGPFFLGDEFSLADAALAPLLMRLQHLGQLAGFDLATWPRIQQWTLLLLQRPSVSGSLPDDWQQQTERRAAAHGSYLVQSAA